MATITRPWLFVENEDSFSWNVIDALPLDRGSLRIVPGADAMGLAEALDSADGVVVGPGPTDPQRAGLVALVREIAKRSLPLLGICLGHQAIGAAFGASVVRTRPCHGEVDAIRLEANRHFAGCAPEQQVMRYHSLALEDVRPPLRVIARNGEGVVMAVEHEALPIAGLQFHPDSYGTPQGRALLAAFFRSV